MHIKDDVTGKHRLSGEEGKKIVKMFETHYVQRIQELCDVIQNKTVEKCYCGYSGYIILFSDNTYMVSYFNDEIKKMDWFYEYGRPVEDDFYIIKYISFKNRFKEFIFNCRNINEMIKNNIEIKKCRWKVVYGATVGEETFNIAFDDNMELDCDIIRDKKNRPYLKLKWEEY